MRRVGGWGLENGYIPIRKRLQKKLFIASHVGRRCRPRLNKLLKGLNVTLTLCINSKLEC